MEQNKSVWVSMYQTQTYVINICVGWVNQNSFNWLLGKLHVNFWPVGAYLGSRLGMVSPPI